MSAVPQVPLRVALRVDASATIGTGHLRRCLSLAEALAEQGAAIILLVRRLDTVAPQMLKGCTFPVRWLPAPGPADAPDPDGPPHAVWAGVAWRRDADETVAALLDMSPQWLVVDHYAIDANWHDVLRDALGCRLLVVDDVADRPLSADILLDQNWAEDHRAKYRVRLTREPKWLTGPRYALLSAAYRNAPHYHFHAEVRSVGIFMGGTDPDGASASVLRCLREEVGFAGPVEVVSTSANPHLGALREACAASPHTMLTMDLPDLAAFFARHDLQIGAGGGATWERCCVGAPTVGLALTANQKATISGLDALGAISAASLGASPSGDQASTVPPLSKALRHLCDTPANRQGLATSSARLVDGRGVDRVGLYLTAGTLRVRNARIEDTTMLYAWRNHPAVRSVSVSTAAIDFNDHRRWMRSVLNARDRWLFVAEVGALAVGSIRFDLTAADSALVSLYIDPALPAMGLGQRMLRCGEEALSGALERTVTVRATVAASNRASVRLFSAGGYSGGPTEFYKRIPSVSQARSP